MAANVITYFDPGFKIHTSYHNSSFILRTPICINGLPVQIRATSQGPTLNFTQSGVSISVKLLEISCLLDPIFLKYGVYHVDTFYYEQFPLFQVAFPSEVSLKRFLYAVDAARSEVESALTGMFTERAQSSEPDGTTPLKVQAKVELFLVSPTHEKNKATNIYPVTLANLSSCTSLWMNSELFEFGRVFATYFTSSKEGHPEPQPVITGYLQERKDTCQKDLATFTIQATGSKPLQCCWEWRPPGKEPAWQPIPGGGDLIQELEATALTITGVHTSNEGRYRCTVTNCAGSEASDTAELTVAESPQISTQPQDQVETVTMAVFTVQATGTEPLTYCWEWKPQGHDEWKALSNGVDDVHGADTATLTIASLQKSHEGSYRCTVTNCAGRMVSESANLTLADRPKIVSHPEDSRDVVAEENITFAIRATGTQPLSYQWDSKPLGNDWQPLPSGGDRIQGVETTTLTITGVQKSHEGSYRCTVSNCAGSEASDTAELTVVVPELRELLNELQDVDDWFHFGIYLKVPVSRLREIKHKYQTVSDRLINVLDEWSNQVVPTWARVVQALVGMGRKTLATHIGSKYGVSVPDYMDKQPSLEYIVTSKEEQVEDGPTSTEVERLKEHVMKLDEQLLQNKEELKSSAASQKVANENLGDIKGKLSEMQDKVQQLVHERNGIQTELRYTEQDVVLLQEMKGVYKTKSEEEKERSKEKEAMLQKIIDEKNKEIRRWREQLRANEAQLEPLYKEVNGLRAELAGKTAELLIKTKQVNDLEREKDQLISTCNSERSLMDMLLQQITAQANSHESYRLEIKQQLSDMSIEQETRAQQLEALTAKNVELEKEIGGLSAALEEREREMTAFQKDDGEEVVKISAMEQEIAELKVKLFQVQSLKGLKQIQRDIMLQDGENVEQFATELHTLLEPPKITTQPRSCDDACFGTAVTFTVQASGIQPLWCRWESEQGNQWVPLPSDGDRIQGVETATLTIDKVQESDEVKYRCIVSNPNGSILSEPATLRLVAPDSPPPTTPVAPDSPPPTTPVAPDSPPPTTPVAPDSPPPTTPVAPDSPPPTTPVLGRLEREYELKEELGRGGFGVVYHVKKRFDSGNFALKITKLPSLKHRQTKVMREVHALVTLDHPRILRYYTSWSERVRDRKVVEALRNQECPKIAWAEFSAYTITSSDDPLSSDDEEGSSRQELPYCLHIQIQLCNKDTLKDWLKKNICNRLKKDVLMFFDQILDAVVYIHRKGLLHRDLKPSNIFFSLEDGSVKVGDFGLVAGLDVVTTKLEQQHKQSHSGHVGTWLYMPPEQMAGSKYDEKVDIYALGVILFELNHPFSTSEERSQVLMEVQSQQKLPRTFAKELPHEVELIELLLASDPAKRPSAKEVHEGEILKILRETIARSGTATIPKFLVPDIATSNSEQICSESMMTHKHGMVTTWVNLTSDKSWSSTETLPDDSVPEAHKTSVALSISRDDSGVAMDSHQYPGLHFLQGSPWQESITSDGRRIHWDDIGIQFDIPAGAVPERRVLHLTVWPCLSGRYVLPDGYNLASPVFMISLEFEFRRELKMSESFKEVKMSMVHFIDLQSEDECKRMVFLSAQSTPRYKDGKPEYHFKVFKKGVFRIGQNSGYISIDHFCGLAIGRKQTNDEGPAENVQYSVQLYHSPDQAVFSVTIVHPQYDKSLAVMLKKQFPEVTFQQSVKAPVYFSHDEVSLDIPTTSMSGWVIAPLTTPCQISKDQVDLPLYNPNYAPSEALLTYPPRVLLTIVHPQDPPHRHTRICELPVLGLTKQFSFQIQLWSTECQKYKKLKHQPSDSGAVPQCSLEDRPNIMEYLKKIRLNDLLLLGENLGLNGAELRQRMHSDTFLFDMIGDWLSRKYKVDTVGKPSWIRLVKGLRAVDHNGIADDIMNDKRLYM